MAYDTTTREALEDTIRKKLEDPNLPASEIKTLAEAYAELHKNDYMKEFLSKTSGFNSFGTAIPSTLETTMEQPKEAKQL